MNANQIIIFGVVIFGISVLLAFLIVFFTPKSKKIDEKKIRVKAKPLENGDLGWDELDIEDLCLVNCIEMEAIYVNKL